MAKALFENLTRSSESSFIVKTFELERFTVPYHFHPELELTLIVRGNGKRYVGKNMEDFDSGDLVLLGSDLPHCWKSHDQPIGITDVRAIVVQFEKDFLGNGFFSTPELSAVHELLKRSAHGIRFFGKNSAEVHDAMERLAVESNPIKKIVTLLEILDLLGNETDYTLLDRDGIVAQQQNSNKERINAALGYIVDNFRNEIELDEVSAVVNMSPNAFCKYFKKVTNKTFMETVIDFRINFAIQQLLATDKAISEISFESGFGDISHFHKLFKRHVKMSPLNYRKNFQKIF